MKHALVYLVGNLPSSLCAGGAVYLASQQITGWGWFLAAAVVLFANIRLNGGNP